MGIGKGYGKTILFGEHFVVYELPAIASALGSVTIAEIKITDGKGWEVDDQRPATLGYKQAKYSDAMQSIKNVLNHLKIDTYDQKLMITFSGDLIAASGVGASAAQCTSLARALSETFNLSLDDEKINQAAYEGEKAYHGTPSGIDNTASTYGGLIWFIKNSSGKNNTMDFLQSPQKMHLVIANSGITASTSEVVSEVRRLREKNPQKFKTIFNKYEMLAKNAKEALLKGDIDSIGEYMNQNQQLLREIGVSGPINEKLIKIAIENGALGAKLTGTGQGGLIIALTANKESQNTIANAIEQEGYDAWKTMIG